MWLHKNLLAYILPSFVFAIFQYGALYLYSFGGHVGSGSDLPSLSAPIMRNPGQQEEYCHVNKDVLDALQSKGVLNPLANIKLPLSSFRSYGSFWGRNHTCFLVQQLLCTEALGGHHLHCNKHSQNRNLQYALLTKAGTMKPTIEAIKAVGKIILGYDFVPFFNRSYQLEGMNQDEVNMRRETVLSDLRGPGLSELRPVGTEWVKKVINGLRNETFKQPSTGRSVSGFSPEEAIANSWHGSFWLHDLQSPLNIPEVRQLAYDPFILDTLQNLLGVPPIIRAAFISFNVAPPEGAPTSNFIFSSWHKDFNTIRTAKVFVYLSDVLEEEDGPHVYIPYTQDVMGPMEKGEIQEKYAESLSAQKLPEGYLLDNLYQHPVKKFFGRAGTTWIEDTHAFHKADTCDRGWRGLLQLDYTASGFCGKDHAALYQVLTRNPPGRDTEETYHHFPRLFQRAQVGYYATPQVPSVAGTPLAKCAIPLETALGKLQYDPSLPDPKSHVEYLEAGFADDGMKDYKSSRADVPCWEHKCNECLLQSGTTCDVCVKTNVCTCSCQATS
jgi:hypothetical protein